MQNTEESAENLNCLSISFSDLKGGHNLRHGGPCSSSKRYITLDIKIIYKCILHKPLR